jgi:hypothetical protein
VITQMSRYAQACCKVDPAAFVKAMGWVSTQNLLARVTWKRAACTALLSLSLSFAPSASTKHLYGRGVVRLADLPPKRCGWWLVVGGWWCAALGIYGTPQFMINGVSSSADESWTMAHWRKLLDPLLL